MMTRLFASRSSWCTSLPSGWTGLLSAALAGALATPAFGPWNIWPLALVSLALLQLLLANQDPKRAAALGYTRLYWYRDGIDAWRQAGLPWIQD